MRILTRYILREVTSHALIGAAIFTFVLFTRDLGHILELVVRASAPRKKLSSFWTPWGFSAQSFGDTATERSSPRESAF